MREFHSVLYEGTGKVVRSSVRTALEPITVKTDATAIHTIRLSLRMRNNLSLLKPLLGPYLPRRYASKTAYPGVAAEVPTVLGKYKELICTVTYLDRNYRKPHQ